MPSASDEKFKPGSRFLLRGLKSRPELNGRIVQIASRTGGQKPPEGRAGVVPVLSAMSSDDVRDLPLGEEGIMAVKHENLVAAELEWEEESVDPTYFEDGERVTSTAYFGSSCYSREKLFVFGGMEEHGDEEELADADSDDEEGLLGTCQVGELMSYDVETRQWVMHWRPGLPSRDDDGGMAERTGDPEADFSVGPPWMERASDGVLLHWGDCVGGRDLLIFYSSPPDKSEHMPGMSNDGAERSFNLNYGEETIDCIYIFRWPEKKILDKDEKPSSDFGYWVKVPTTGTKPNSTLQGKQCKSGFYGNRKVRAAIYLDPNDDGVRVVLWGGMYWAPEQNSSDPALDARSSVAMSGMFELHIPGSHLGPTAGSKYCPHPKWSLLPQHGSLKPMVRHEHSFTRVGRDLIVLGGESVNGQECILPGDEGTEKDLGHWAYNLDTHTWRKLDFAPFGPALKPLECISDHLAFALSHNRILVVRQSDDIYRHAEEDEELDNCVLVFDLEHMTVHPLSTFSMTHNLRPEHDRKNAIGRPLLGLSTSWFHCGIFCRDGVSRLVVHGRVCHDEGKKEFSRWASWRCNGSLYSAELIGMDRPRYELDERTPTWCRRGGETPCLERGWALR